ncbi:MAG: histidine phosphatase family protein [Cyanobacteria bacterium J06560_6]
MTQSSPYFKLVLIRHAESLGNTQKIMEGQGSTALSVRGQRQAQRLADVLVPSQLSLSALPSSALPTCLYSSPLLRASQTATVLHQALRQLGHAVPVHHSNQLQEIHPGIFQGLTWIQVTQQYPELCDRLMTSLAWQPVPQAESPTEARDRAHSWLTQILNRHRPDDTVWAVSHAGLMVQMVSAIMGCDRTWQVPIRHTAIFEFQLAHTHWHSLTEDRFNPEYWILKRFNDSQHIKG